MILREDDRGAAIALNHALSIGITTLLIAGLMLGAGQQLETRQERVAEQGLKDIGESLANEVTRIDRLAVDDGEVRSDISSRISYPHYVSGEGYEVSLQRSGGAAVLSMQMNSPDVRIPINISVESDVCERELNGGPIKVVYDADGDDGDGKQDGCLTIRPTGR